MRLARFERQAQRLAWAEQVLLADHLVRRLRAQLLGERGEPACLGRSGKQVFRHPYIASSGEVTPRPPLFNTWV